MSDSAASHLARASRSAAMDRRAFVRAPANLETSCEMPAWLGDASWWPATVRNISLHGLGMVLGRWFKEGTILDVELPDNAQGFSRRLPVRVIHSTVQEAGNWLVGCAFINQLSEAELRALAP